MHTGISSDGEDGAAPTAAGPSQVIQFRRAPPQLGSAAGDEPASSPAIPLGSAVQAVVMRLANKRIRIRVESPSREEEDWGSR
ncbi:hypothetical protein ASD63_16605 [Ensifer sp. Root558]|nr:hypothetical protein [Ensifer sp. Root558]KQZ41820.1 hypothetical protein ASD63_16605 [Ensifer sp. Root558]